MSDEGVRDALRARLVDDLFFGEPGEIADDDDLFELGLDSMGITRLLVFIERTLGVRLPDREITAERMQTVERIAQMVEEHR